MLGEGLEEFLRGEGEAWGEEAHGREGFGVGLVFEGEFEGVGAGLLGLWLLGGGFGG